MSSEVSFNTFSGYKVVLPDSTTRSQTVAFAEQFYLWAVARESSDAWDALSEHIAPAFVDHSPD